MTVRPHPARPSSRRLTIPLVSALTLGLAWAAAGPAVGTQSQPVPAVAAVDAAAGAVTTTSTTPSTATPGVEAADVQVPTAPGRPVATLVDGLAWVDLVWSPAADDVGVAAYRVRRAGVVIATVETPAFRDRAPLIWALYDVQAIDVAGNAGPFSPALPLYNVFPPPMPPRREAAPPAVPPAVPPTVAPPAAAPDVVAPVHPDRLASGAAPDRQAPTAPGPAAVAAGLTAVALRWPAATDDRRVVGYTVARAGLRIATVPTTTFLDTGLAPATTYIYTVRAHDAAGNTGPAVVVQARTRRWVGAVTVSRASARRSARRWTVRVVAHTAEAPRAAVACAWRLDRRPWRPCRFDPSGTLAVAVRTVGRPGSVSVRATDPSGQVWTTRRRVG